DDEAELRSRRDRAEEDREEPGLEEQRLPTEGVEGLADVHDREVEDPEEREYDHRREREGVQRSIEEPGHRDERHRDPGPGDEQELAVRIADEMKERRRGAERDRANELRRG